MCVDCWNEAGQPANWTPEIAEALALVRELYAIHPTGGPLHTTLDDWNIDGDRITPWYASWDDTELDALYYDGWLIADLDPQAPAVTEGLGRSTRQICDEIAAKMGPMTEADRMSVLAYHGKLATPPEA
ncbi:hypothetical protein Rhe02_55070 [Rhizocola hellebori]|uniref:Uncharacterized protein n=1 Tax=Rhizocola hellebori TaxID=1392758 RepID=A0A8J3QBC4_9ACTN|nr:hypothetical protein [Rhizocola hellebori]GIH07440.1 hypothetical protein Rhe02_55070 [Rhizocola hellebori]